MKKLLGLFALGSFLMSFTTKVGVHILEHPKTLLTTIGITGVSATKAQTFLTKEAADTLYKLKNYVPVITDPGGGYHILIDGVALYDLPPVDYNRDVQSKPVFSGVAFSGDFRDLGFTPTIPTSGFGIFNNNNQWNVDTASSNGIMSKDRASAAISTMTASIDTKVPKTMSITINGVTQNLSASRTWSIPTATNTNQLVNGSGFLTSEVDGSTTNELQTISSAGKSFTLSAGGGSFTVPNVTASEINTAIGGTVLTTESQSLAISGNILSIKTGSNTVNSVTIPSAGSASLSVTGSSLTVSGGNTVNLKKPVPYSVTTNASGIATFTFSNAYSVAPNIQANIIGGTPNQFITMTVSTTGFTVNVFQRNTVTLLSTEVLLGTTVSVSGANVDVLITEK